MVFLDRAAIAPQIALPGSRTSGGPAGDRPDPLRARAVGAKGRGDRGLTIPSPTPQAPPPHPRAGRKPRREPNAGLPDLGRRLGAALRPAHAGDRGGQDRAAPDAARRGRRHRRDERRASSSLRDQGRTARRRGLSRAPPDLRDPGRAGGCARDHRLRPGRARPEQAHGCARRPRPARRDPAPAVAAALRDPGFETPATADPRLARAEFHLIAAPRTSLEAASPPSCRLLGDVIEGEAGQVFAGIARAMRKGRPAFAAPCILVPGGETAAPSPAQATGGGGPSVQFPTGCARGIRRMAEIAATASGADGIDGAAGVAKAMLDGAAAARARATGLTLDRAMADRDGRGLFAAPGDQVICAPTSSTSGPSSSAPPERKTRSVAGFRAGARRRPGGRPFGAPLAAEGRPGDARGARAAGVRRFSRRPWSARRRWRR